MKDLDEIQTRHGTPLIAVLSRLAFALFFATAAYLLFGQEEGSLLTVVWLAYLAIIYVLCEHLYARFRARGIDLTFAMPLLFAIYVMSFISLLFNAQEKLPLLNRVEHFAVFVLITFTVWVFFMKYLPHGVWREHPIYTAWLVISVVSFIGVINELIELAFDVMLGTQYVGARWDTALDLLMNTLGAGIFLAVRLLMRGLEDERGWRPR